jgi:putative transposase
MPKSRKSYPPSLKARVVVEALKNQKTAGEIAQVYSIHPALVSTWKKQALEALPGIFQQPRGSREGALDAERDELYQQIGRLKVELDWLKKRSGLLG